VRRIVLYLLIGSGAARQPAMAAVLPNWRHLYIVGSRQGKTGSPIDTPHPARRELLCISKRSEVSIRALPNRTSLARWLRLTGG
jgi:hypothetical protein